MKKLAILFLLTTPALAQQPVPYTVEPRDHQQLMQQLGEIPAKWAIPIMQTLEQLAQQAQMRSRVEERRQPQPGETK